MLLFVQFLSLFWLSPLYMQSVVDVLSPNAPFCVSSLFFDFINNFRDESGFIYKTALHRAILSNESFLEVSLNHISCFSDNLLSAIIQDPGVVIHEIEAFLCNQFSLNQFSLQILSESQFLSLKSIRGNLNNKIVRVQCLVVSVSVPVLKVLKLKLVCSKCLKSVFSDVMLRFCSNDCGPDSFVISEDSIVVPEQIIKVQELFEDVSLGEMPVTMKLVLQKQLINKIRTGSTVTATGIVQIIDGEAVIRVLGMKLGQKDSLDSFSEDEIAVFHRVKQFAHPLLRLLTAPHVLGHKFAKQALLCVLFGGTQRNKNGNFFRGDVHLLLLGDPGCAKTALLRFAHCCVPGSLAAGGGASAAGLTAAVVRRKGQKELCLEAGALVIADNGVACIDEFDKMEERDKVALHEAMEQQTISIAKAGICATLRTRCAVLAAANPAFGRFDESKDLSENITLGRTLLSRFDCIFLIKDTHSTKGDLSLARHMLSQGQPKVKNLSHQENDSLSNINIFKNEKDDFYDEKTNGFHCQQEEGPQVSIFELNPNFTWDSPEHALRTIDPESIFKTPIEFLRKYIKYAKKTTKPTLTKEAGEKLTKYYVQARQISKNTIPITVRQLESLIRMSEALAKMELSNQATTKHVHEAIKIFENSTIKAIKTTTDDFKEIQQLSTEILKIMEIGHGMKIQEIEQQMGIDSERIEQAIRILEKQGRVALKEHGTAVIRL